MKRKPSPRVTSEMAAQMKAMKARGLFNHQIASYFEVNQGRVSEVMTGKLHPGVPPADQGQLPF